VKNKWDNADSSSYVYRGRFSPSPTGPLHLGSLYTAVASFLEARSQQGQWLLRIEDLDTPRNQKGAVNHILKTLDTFGLHWDERVVYQSQQPSYYQAAIEILRKQQRLYPSTSSRKHLKSYTIYPQFCRHKPFKNPCKGALRLKTIPQKILFHDQLQGNILHEISTDHGDFIIQRNDKIIAYQLAVSVDDQRQGITHIVRGIDLLHCTAKQIYLQKLLNFSQPEYTHLPIIMNKLGQKLSKQTFAKSVSETPPQKMLYHILTLLQQAPPLELKNAPVTELLSWAMTHWSSHLLKNIKSFSIQD
jgi:glutamyl-Q tRNA(Asp) synthetase